MACIYIIVRHRNDTGVLENNGVLWSVSVYKKKKREFKSLVVIKEEKKNTG